MENNMEILSACPVCGKPDFTRFLNGRDYFLSGEEYTIVYCNHCGMKFLNPRPDATGIAKYYLSPDYVSHDAEQKSILNFVYRLVRNFTIGGKYRLIRKYSSGKFLLDIGCGTGEFLRYCRQKGFDVKGIEPGEKPRTFARTEHQLDVAEESYLDGLDHPSFDIVTMWHVLEHVHRLDERMKKIETILNPGGTLVIAVPNCDSWDAVHFGEFWAAYDLPRHLYHFSQSTMKLLAENHGFKIEKIIPMKLDAFYICLLSEKYSKGKQNYFSAVMNGIRSNTFARKNKNNYSSLIYILRRVKNEK
ncbi:MAG: methyltransferase domain-containing protein [Bacteroidetes bacterium]|nr:methyltransferase domain-containing protein [Bacteroidota bacterium]